MEKMDPTRTDCNLTHMGFAFNVCCDLGIGRSPASASQSTAESRGVAPRAQGGRRDDRGPTNVLMQALAVKHQEFLSAHAI